MKVLLIEDDEIVRETLLDILAYKQHTADGAASAEEALKKLPDEYDIVITDVFLKGRMDGVELMDRIHQMPREMPVVVITGFGDRALEERCRKGGAAAFLRKPFTIDTLLSTMQRAVKR